MTEKHVNGFAWELPGGAFFALFLARMTTALTWGWTALTVNPWNQYGWFEDALIISQHHTWVPGWDRVAELLLAHQSWAAPLFFLLNLVLFVTLALGFATRLTGSIATVWAGIIVVLAISIPKTGAFIPPDFPVPIGGWFWLLGPIALFPLVAATSAGRIWGLDGKLRGEWLHAGGWKTKIAQWM